MADDSEVASKVKVKEMQGRNIKILLVEDNPGDARLIRERLKEASDGWVELVEAGRLDEALELVKQSSFDVLLLDLMLPDSQGLDTFIKANTFAAHVPIVVLTGLADEEAGVEAVKWGAQDYLAKGDVDGKLLVRSLRYAMERKQANEALEESFRKLSRMTDGIIRAISLTVERRDAYTAGHQDRVTRLACAIAVEMRLSNQQIQAVRIAGLLHDIGKINIPTEILSKPGKLTDIEFALIKTHPQAAYDVLKNVEFPWPIADIALQHHERMNSSGYPSGLRGEKILLEARILAVSDVVEAMASHRPYRPALGRDKALQEISQNRGLLYDPKVVDACLRVFESGSFKFEE